MKKLIFFLFFSHISLLSGSMCSSSSLAQAHNRGLSTSTVSLNNASSSKCEHRAKGYQDLVEKITSLIDELSKQLKLTTQVYIELNNSAKASADADPCFATATSQGKFIIHIYPKLYRQCTPSVQKFLLSRLLIQIRDYPQTLTEPLFDSTKISRIVTSGISQSLTTLPEKTNELAYQQLDQLSLMESPYESVIRIICTAFLKGIGLAAQSYAQERINFRRELTLILDYKSAELDDEHRKGAFEYLERRDKQEKTWSMMYTLLQKSFGYVKASERLEQLA